MSGFSTTWENTEYLQAIYRIKISPELTSPRSLSQTQKRRFIVNKSICIPNLYVKIKYFRIKVFKFGFLNFYLS